jgi:hypothetical protein
MGAFLQAMLQERWPDRRVEVINLGTTAVASFPLVYLTRAAVERQPDLVVLYVGNNEFFGAYGTASISASGTMPPTALPWVRAVRGSAVVQGIESLVRGRSSGDRTLMEQMIGQTVIPSDAGLRRAAADNLGGHIEQMVEACRAAGVPVLVCTTASNEAGLVPLGQEGLEGQDSEARATIERELAVARMAATGDAATAERAARAVLERAPQPVWRLGSAPDDAQDDAERHPGRDGARPPSLQYVLDDREDSPRDEKRTLLPHGVEPWLETWQAWERWHKIRTGDT